ncbi:hypothetical protein GC170_14815 [bacterium]|nr:hypothetical protein [bacterium]
MATIPVGVAILLLVPASGTDALSANRPAAERIRVDAGLKQAGYEREAVKVVHGTPPLPSRSLPRAVDARGKVVEPVIPADYEVEVSAEEEGLPSPQSPRRVTELPPLAPVPSGSPEPTA